MLVAMRRIGVGDLVISEQAKANVNDALNNNRLSYGPWTKQFERRFANLHGRKHAAFVNSGTDALRIGLAAMKEKYGWADGARVIVPALTFVASVNVILQNNLTPVLVDIEPDYYGPDWEQVYGILGRYEASGEGGAVAMMPVFLFGQAYAIPPIVKAITRVIVDSCETMFVDTHAEGDVSCFSTYACHILQTGVGGLITTDNPELATLIRSYANHGRDGIYTGIDDALGDPQTMSARFRFERVGYSSRATELEAAIGCAELDVWQDNLRRRKEIADRYTAGLAGLPLTLPKVRPSTESAWMMYPIRAQDEIVRDALTVFLEQRGIETRPLLPLTNQPVYQRMWGDDLEDRYPVARMVNRTGFYIGCFPSMTDDDVEYVIAAFKEFFE